MDYSNYEKEVERMKEKNSEYLKKFKGWLKKKGLADKTIKQHLSNVDLYINDFLNYYEVTEMKDGCYMLDGFLGDWFVHKCMWSSVNSIKQNAASIKKFYACMSEVGYIQKKDYEYLCCDIKESMEDWIKNMEIYDSDDFDLMDIFE